MPVVASGGEPVSTREWIERVYADAPGSLVVAHETTGGAFEGAGGQCTTHEAAARRIEVLEAAGCRSVYLRATTVARTLSPFERGGSADAYFLPGLWGDVDFGEVGHAHDAGRRTRGGRCHPDEAEARRIVVASGLPDPSVWVHSGGGLYPWWLLEKPAEVTDENRVDLGTLSARWQNAIQASAHRLGYDYGAGVGDLARVLRVPGTTNRKAGQERPCRLLEDTGQRYTVAELLGALPAPVDLAPPASAGVCGPHPRLARGVGPLPVRGRDDLGPAARPVRLHAVHRPARLRCRRVLHPPGQPRSTPARLTSWPPTRTSWWSGRSRRACRSALGRSSPRPGCSRTWSTGGDLRAAARSLTPPGPDQEPPTPQTDQEGQGTPTYAFVPGGSFILDTSPDPEPLWGSGTEVLLAEGEALIIAGGQGLGKTTLAQQLTLGRCGFGEYADLLGWPIKPGAQRTLYLAMDRPNQASRSFRRMVGEQWRADLDDRLVVWRGPPPADLARYTGLLLDLCRRAAADTVVVDSLKDAAIGLTDDEVGAGYNRARQTAIAAGVEVVELHHNRKASNTGKRVVAIDDLYGSTWLTSGVGSVLLLTGAPGDPIVNLQQLKQPADEVGPL